MILNHCCMLILFFYVPDKKKKKDADCNVAVNWAMLFIYGTGHFMHLFSPRSHFLTRTRVVIITPTQLLGYTMPSQNDE